MRVNVNCVFKRLSVGYLLIWSCQLNWVGICFMDKATSQRETWHVRCSVRLFRVCAGSLRWAVPCGYWPMIGTNASELRFIVLMLINLRALFVFRC
jgi:hypothetical protein